MQYDVECMTCLVQSQAKLCRGLGTEKDRREYMQDVFAAFLDVPEGVAAPWFIPKFTLAFEKHFGVEDPYREIKQFANEQSMKVLPELEEMARKAEDPLLEAMKISRTGNFLDFAVLAKETVENGLEQMIQKIPGESFPMEEYGRFSADLEKAERLVILGDNAGEIVFDTVLVKELKNRYPKLEITYVVRGGRAQNDATFEDAAFCGMDRLVNVIGNGSCIPGTEPGFLSDELKTGLDRADVILSKGQANFETLVMSGMNIYYLFLCKCPKFSRRFGVEPMTGMFLNDQRNEAFRIQED